METKTAEKKKGRAVRTRAPYVTESSPPAVLTGKTLSSSRELYAETADFRGAEQEHYIVWDLDGAGRILARRTVGIGTQYSVSGAPPDIFRQAIRNGAIAVAMVHNHPSGDHEPSRADVMLAFKNRAAGEIVGIHVMDQLVVSAQGFTSLHDRIDHAMGGMEAPESIRPLLDMLTGKLPRGVVIAGGPISLDAEHDEGSGDKSN